MVTSYGTLLRLPQLEALQWNLVVLDEAQAIKNPSARQTRAAKKLRGRARVALTGTPVENRLSDLWSIFDFAEPRAARLRAGVHRVHEAARGAAAQPASSRCARWSGRTCCGG